MDLKALSNSETNIVTHCLRAAGLWVVLFSPYHHIDDCIVEIRQSRSVGPSIIIAYYYSTPMCMWWPKFSVH